MKTLKTIASYLIALPYALALVALLKVACILDRATRETEARGERFDAVDDAIARLDAIHNSLFGCEE